MVAGVPKYKILCACVVCVVLLFILGAAVASSVVGDVSRVTIWDVVFEKLYAAMMFSNFAVNDMLLAADFANATDVFLRDTRYMVLVLHSTGKLVLALNNAEDNALNAHSAAKEAEAAICPPAPRNVVAAIEVTGNVLEEMRRIQAMGVYANRSAHMLDAELRKGGDGTDEVETLRTTARLIQAALRNTVVSGNVAANTSGEAALMAALKNVSDARQVI